MVSIITPVYNSARWLIPTIESVIRQTYADWEMILVDDGSTDESLEIIKRFSAEDPRIRFKEVEHRGVAAIRNLGLALARGNHIFFLDSDDIIPEYSIEYLCKLISVNKKISIAGGKILRFDDDIGEKGLKRLYSYEYNGENDKISGNPDILRNIKLYCGKEGVIESLYQTGIEASLCGRIFNRSVFNDLHFYEGEYYEDLNLFYKILLNGNYIAESDVPVYFYRQRAGSITHKFGKERLIVLEVTRRICDYMSDNHPDILPAAIDRRFSANCNMLQLMLKHAGDDPDKEYFRDKMDEAYRFIRENAGAELCNRKIRLKNRIGALGALMLPRSIFQYVLKKF